MIIYSSQLLKFNDSNIVIFFFSFFRFTLQHTSSNSKLDQNLLNNRPNNGTTIFVSVTIILSREYSIIASFSSSPSSRQTKTIRSDVCYDPFRKICNLHVIILPFYNMHLFNFSSKRVVKCIKSKIMFNSAQKLQRILLYSLLDIFIAK